MSDADLYGLCVVCGEPRTVVSRLVEGSTTFVMVCSVDPSHDTDASDPTIEEER